MRFWLARVVMLGMAAICLTRWAQLPTVVAQQVKSQWDAIYSEPQATRGQALYVENCVICHASSLAGTDAAPALTGAGFIGKWNNKPLDELFEFMQTAMPVQSPGGLSRQQNADILAYMLRSGRFPSGQTELTPDRHLLRQIYFVASKPGSGTPPPAASPGEPAPKPATRVVEPVQGAGNGRGRFYADVQAERGRLLFNRHCGYCHSVDPRIKNVPKSGTMGAYNTFGGTYLEQRMEAASHKKLYPSVYYLFTRLAQMPPNDAYSVSQQSKADIVAYILQANGFPAGPNELTTDTGAMKSMMIGEPGFQPIFNGRDFTGIKFILGPGCRPAPLGCGKTDPGSVVWVEDGMIACACHVHGIWYTEQKYLNFTLRFDYKFKRPADWDATRDNDIYQGQSGYFMFVPDVTDRRPTARGVGFDGRHFDVLHAPFAENAIEDHEARLRVNKPLGEWNSVEIVARDGMVKAFLNGALITTIPEHPVKEPGHIVVQIQGAPMYWRNLRIRPE
jgi:mono/diheme cytochrome c family protein